MGKLFGEAPQDIIDWIALQKLFFVATAPKSTSHHINCSPKGHDTFTIVSPRSCYYLDLSGSGNETISHLEERGSSRRITLMWAAFEGPPQIVRFFGTGRALLLDTNEFDELIPREDERRLPGARAIIWIDVHAVTTSCGFSMPKLTYQGDRDTLLKFMERKEANDEQGKEGDGMRAYWMMKNSVSIDDLPGPGRKIGIKHPDSPAFSKRLAYVSTLKRRPRLDVPPLLLGVLIGIASTTGYLAVRNVLS